ncbi:FUSC family protein [Macrococcoides caseolyticum]|uniref:FUSC family protein n=1 Tax=Macrococcoides caseolyticum TaxID=69966 RepID=UPI001F44563E|nr:aromatic acid exporter family protein [Macrococcus caseolyticus]MCE4957499.1 aromatic acid exporter family protein [Macrococcus caseolyticus]
MKIKWTKKIIGARTIKTGLATFLTALFCQALGLPPIFAVITSIVSIEPTARASLKKAFVRFPASILGAFIAVMSTYFLGESPLSFSIAATLTLYICYQLKLYDGMLVASLTAVAMVPNIHQDFAYNFFSRLATTTIGLSTATIVNFFVLPPKYHTQIASLMDILETKLMKMLIQRSSEINADLTDLSGALPMMEQTNKLIAKIDTLLAYEKEEMYFHKNLEVEYELTRLRHRLDVNRLIQLHINHMILIPNGTAFVMTNDEKDAINQLMKAFETFGDDRTYIPNKPSLSLLKMSVKHLTEFDDNQMKSHYIYELLMINKLLMDHPNKKKQV